MARLGRREPFKPILSGLIQYQPAPAAPVGSKQFVISYAAKQSAKAFHIQRPRVLLTGLIKYAIATNPPPLGSRGFMVSRQAIATAIRRQKSYRPRRVYSAAPPAIFPAVLRIDPGLTFVHEINDDNPRTRKALQQMSDALNSLRRSGELKGPFGTSALGYVPENTMNWNGDEPGTIREALNRIASALASLGQKP